MAQFLVGEQIPGILTSKVGFNLDKTYFIRDSGLNLVESTFIWIILDKTGFYLKLTVIINTSYHENWKKLNLLLSEGTTGKPLLKFMPPMEDQWSSEATITPVGNVGSTWDDQRSPGKPLPSS